MNGYMIPSLKTFPHTVWPGSHLALEKYLKDIDSARKMICWLQKLQQTEHIEGLVTVLHRCRIFQTTWETLTSVFQSTKHGNS